MPSSSHSCWTAWPTAQRLAPSAIRVEQRLTLGFGEHLGVPDLVDAAIPRHDCGADATAVRPTRPGRPRRRRRRTAARCSHSRRSTVRLGALAPYGFPQPRHGGRHARTLAPCDARPPDLHQLTAGVVESGRTTTSGPGCRRSTDRHNPRARGEDVRGDRIDDEPCVRRPAPPRVGRRPIRHTRRTPAAAGRRRHRLATSQGR